MEYNTIVVPRKMFLSMLPFVDGLQLLKRVCRDSELNKPRYNCNRFGLII
jgi:hypothetical protein